MHTVHANGATVGRLGNETYLQISVNGCEVSCLLDTGCEKSMLPRRLIPNTPLQPVDISVDAANGIKIPILGSVDCNSRSISSRFSTQTGSIRRERSGVLNGTVVCQHHIFQMVWLVLLMYINNFSKHSIHRAVPTLNSTIC